MKTDTKQTSTKQAKVYIKAVDLKAASYKNGGAVVNAFQVMIDFKNGESATTAAAYFGKLANETAAFYLEQKNAKTEQTEKARTVAEFAKTRAKELGKKKTRRTAAIVAASEIANILGGKLADKLAAELESAKAQEVEWKAYEERAKAERAAKYAETHAEEIAKKKAQMEQKAREIVEQAQKKAAAILAKIA